MYSAYYALHSVINIFVFGWWSCVFLVKLAVFYCMFGRETVDVSALSNNVRIIAESVAQQIYNLTEADMPQLFTNGLVWHSQFLRLTSIAISNLVAFSELSWNVVALCKLVFNVQLNCVPVVQNLTFVFVSSLASSLKHTLHRAVWNWLEIWCCTVYWLTEWLCVEC